jgi:hypothetical protein
MFCMLCMVASLLQQCWGRAGPERPRRDLLSGEAGAPMTPFARGFSFVGSWVRGLLTAIPAAGLH